jgi:hypothetical protein
MAKMKNNIIMASKMKGSSEMAAAAWHGGNGMAAWRRIENSKQNVQQISQCENNVSSGMKSASKIMAKIIIMAWRNGGGVMAKIIKWQYQCNEKSA